MPVGCLHAIFARRPGHGGRLAGRALLVGRPGPSAQVGWFTALDWGGFLATLLIAAGGGLIGMALRIPAGALLVPMAMAALLEAMGLVNIVLPPWLLAITYALLGWSIGLSFNRQILQHAARALLPIMLAIGVMIGVCAALAAVLVHYAGIDPLTAYLPPARAAWIRWRSSGRPARPICPS